MTSAKRETSAKRKTSASASAKRPRRTMTIDLDSVGVRDLAVLAHALGCTLRVAFEPTKPPEQKLQQQPEQLRLATQTVEHMSERLQRMEELIDRQLRR